MAQISDEDIKTILLNFSEGLSFEALEECIKECLGNDYKDTTKEHNKDDESKGSDTSPGPGVGRPNVEEQVGEEVDLDSLVDDFGEELKKSGLEQLVLKLKR